MTLEDHAYRLMRARSAECVVESTLDSREQRELAKLCDSALLEMRQTSDIACDLRRQANAMGLDLQPTADHMSYCIQPMQRPGREL